MAKTFLELGLMALGHGDAIGDDEHIGLLVIAIAKAWRVCIIHKG